MPALRLAPQRVHPSLVLLQQIKSRLIELRSQPLGGDQIFGDEGQILTAPPETEETPETSTTPAPACANDVSLTAQIAAIDDAHFLALNIDADRSERDHQRAEIARMEAEQEDAHHCGQSCDYSVEIEAAHDTIRAINERLYCYDR